MYFIKILMLQIAPSLLAFANFQALLLDHKTFPLQAADFWRGQRGPADAAGLCGGLLSQLEPERAGGSELLEHGFHELDCWPLVPAHRPGRERRGHLSF